VCVCLSVCVRGCVCACVCARALVCLLAIILSFEPCLFKSWLPPWECVSLTRCMCVRVGVCVRFAEFTLWVCAYWCVYVLQSPHCVCVRAWQLHELCSDRWLYCLSLYTVMWRHTQNANTHAHTHTSHVNGYTQDRQTHTHARVVWWDRQETGLLDLEISRVMARDTHKTDTHTHTHIYAWCQEIDKKQGCWERQIRNSTLLWDSTLLRDSTLLLEFCPLGSVP